MEGKLIFDVGMNNGDDTAYYLSKGYRVVGIEANPALAQQVVDRMRPAVERGALTVLNIAIASSEGVLPFWICDEVPEWSSFDRKIASRNGSRHHQIEVQCRRFRSVVGEFGVPYAIKIDIEGHDFICAKDLEAGRVPKYMSIELSEAVNANLAMFRDLGFKHFKLINQRHFLPIERGTRLHEQKVRALLLLRDSHAIPVRIARRLGGRSMLERYLERYRVQDGWTFRSVVRGRSARRHRGAGRRSRNFAQRSTISMSFALRGARACIGEAKATHSGPTFTCVPE